jgi:hypothetical protein
MSVCKSVWNGFDHSLNLTKTNLTPTQPNPTQPKPQPQVITFSPLNHVKSSLNFQDIFHIIYQHDIISLQSGSLNILQVPNFSFLRQIMSDIDQTFRISSISSETLFRMSKFTPSFKSPVRNHQDPPSPKIILSQSEHVRSWSNFQDKPLSNYILHILCSTQPNPSSFQSGTINILQASL